MTLNPRAGIVEAFDVSVLDAAGQLGITPGAVRQAIHAKRLSGIKRGGRFYVARRSLES